MPIYELEFNVILHKEESTSLRIKYSIESFLQKNNYRFFHIYGMVYEGWLVGVEIEDIFTFQSLFENEHIKVDEEVVIMTIYGKLNPDEEHWSYGKKYRELLNERN